jgi:putative transposase
LRTSTRNKGLDDDQRDYDLARLLEKTTDAGFLREMIGFTDRRLMDVEVEALTDAAPGMRAPNRLNQRTGYRDRTW